MATSARYNTLVNRIKQLEGHLLPTINPTGSYTPQDHDLVRAYCLLCHAEIEAYLEDYAKEIVDKAYKKWDANKSMISPIIFHLAFNYNGKREPPYSMVVKSYQALHKAIQGNHGIKDNNLNALFRPIGYDVDTTLENTLTSFGGNRGQIAHQSFQTQTPLDPLTERTTVNLILTGLATFDEDLSNYESTGLTTRWASIKWKFNLLERLKILFTGST